MRSLHWTAGLLALTLTACGSQLTPYKIAPAPTTNKTAVEVQTVITQTDIEAIVPVVDSSGAVASYGLVGALVGAAIDSSTNSSNQDMYQRVMTPVQNSVIDYKFDQKFEQMIQSTVSTVPSLTPVGFKLVKEKQDKPTFSQPTLHIETSYRLSTDMRSLDVDVWVSLMPATQPKAKEEAKPLYQNRFTYRSPLLADPVKTPADVAAIKKEVWAQFDALPEKQKKNPKEVSKRNRALAKAELSFTPERKLEVLSQIWAANKGELIRKELDTAMQDLAVLIQTDFNDQQAPASLFTKPVVKNNGVEQTYEIVTQRENRILVRTVRGWMTGAMCSLPQNDVRNCD